MERIRGRVLWVRALLIGGLISGLLGACAVTDPVDRRYDDISRSWAKARNESIFLNLLRASYSDPLSFTTVSNVTPSMTNVTGFALPTFSIGPPNCLRAAVAAPNNVACTFPTGALGAPTGFGNTTANNSTTVSSNFSISTQETSAFYSGFLKPIDLSTLNYFIRQGYPLEMLFWLFADSFELQTGSTPTLTNSVRYEYNPPDSYGCPRHDMTHRCFREWIWVALLSGLTVEEKSIVTKFNSAYVTTPVTRFCFNPQLGQKAENEMGPTFAAYIKRKYMQGIKQVSPICGTWQDNDAEEQLANPEPDNFTFTVGGATFRIVPRSAYGVFEFLGTLIRMQRDNTAPTPGKAFLWSARLGEPDEAVVPPLLKTVDGTPPLFSVVPSGDRPCFVHTWYLSSDFCVAEDDTNSKQIMSLLAQLTAITTQASDLSITPVVRVIQ
jgi:hypothetical protein